MRQGAGFVEKLVVGHHPGHQAAGQRFVRFNAVAGERHLRRLGKAHHPLQQPGAAVAGNDAQLHEALREPGAFAGDAQVAHAGQVAAGAHRRAVHRRDHRHFQLLERQRNALDALFVVEPGLGRAGVVEAAGGAHLLDVAAAGEGAAGAGEDRHAGVRVGFQPLQRRQQCLDHVVVGDRVAGLRAVESEGDDAVLVLIADQFAHGNSMLVLDR